MRDVIVVGAGASGLMAAVMAARGGAKVRILESMKKPGRKLLITGNGRCNLTNTDPDLAGAYYSESKEEADRFAESVLKTFGREDTLAFFEQIGLFAARRGPYVYPRSGQAVTVLNMLLEELARLYVQLKQDTRVQKIYRDPAKKKWLAAVEGWTYEADAVIVCAGSRAAPVTGSDGSGYALARSLGHKVRRAMPALTALTCPDPDLKLCAGARTRAAVTLLKAYGGTTGILPDLKETERSGGCRILAQEEGELQWNASEISGIPVFQLSRFVHGLQGTALLSIDFLPEYEETQVRRILTDQLLRAGSGASLTLVLNGFVQEKIAAFLVKKSGWPERLRDCADCGAVAGDLAALLKRLILPVDGTRGFDQAQVCAGGVCLDQIDPRTLESKLHRGLFFAGEVLDIDGPCGGYNLQWAWSSGAAAGMAAARAVSEDRSARYS